MTPEERARVVEELPGHVEWKDWGMPEGMFHDEGCQVARDLVLTRCEQQGRAALVAVDLPVHYPGEEFFSPDVLVVLDVDPHLRQKWVVSQEGKGLDWVLEVHVAGDKTKDTVEKVKRYAELGIPECFLYDRTREELLGYRLGAPGDKVYTRIEPQEGRYRSEVLGLELGVVDQQLCAWVNGEPLLPSKFVSVLKTVAERSTQRAETEARQREEAERQLAQLKAELERLRPK